MKLLQSLKRDGHSIAAYGASAKGTTLLNYCGLSDDVLDFVADRSPVKQGKLTPGTHLPIVPPEMLTTARPDYCLLLTWNFADEILAQQAAYRAMGGKFIIPVPQVRIALSDAFYTAADRRSIPSRARTARRRARLFRTHLLRGRISPARTPDRLRAAQRFLQ